MLEPTGDTRSVGGKCCQDHFRRPSVTHIIILFAQLWMKNPQPAPNNGQYGGANPYGAHQSEATDFQPSQTNTPKQSDFSNIHYVSGNGAMLGSGGSGSHGSPYVALETEEDHLEMLDRKGPPLEFWQKLLMQLLPCATGFPYPTKESVMRWKRWNVVQFCVLALSLIVLAITFVGVIAMFILEVIVKGFIVSDVPFEFFSSGINARGVIAMGINARGFIAIGVFACGFFSVGTCSIGVVSLGAASLGIWFALGCGAASCGYSLGIVALGTYVQNAILGVGLWEAENVMIGSRVLSPLFEWYSFFPVARAFYRSQKARREEIIQKKRESGKSLENLPLPKAHNNIVFLFKGLRVQRRM
uniref:Uncharacterized protein n=1 Tax=Percolomonas cosmopolitus TaxID=63605 RepID=A0A7S1KRC7_9EUKA|mmetsp:Transcript_6308/g.23763  ORF Transcript_6308/g.23763 Transcript_6308/m.23763 type:complete len:358 (+) Transcript_6308:125-1198(+)